MKWVIAREAWGNDGGPGTPEPVVVVKLWWDDDGGKRCIDHGVDFCAA